MVFLLRLAMKSSIFSTSILFTVLYMLYKKCGIIICLLEKKMLFFAVSIKRNTNWSPSLSLGFFYVLPT